MVPITFPLTRMFTPTKVSCESASITVPETVVCAKAPVKPKETSNASEKTDLLRTLVKLLISDDYYLGLVKSAF